jgi:hypothetical protein
MSERSVWRVSRAASDQLRIRVQPTLSPERMRWVGKPMKRSTVIMAVAAAVVVVATVGSVLGLRHKAAGSTSVPPARVATASSEPAGARAVVQLLLSAHGRSVLTPELDAALPRGSLFPEGTAFAAEPRSWRQTGDFANVTGTLHEPGHSSQWVVIGLVHRGSRWLVTSEGSL